MSDLTTKAIDLAVVTAQIAWAVNRAYASHMGDTSKPSWWEASPEMRQFVVDGVRDRLKDPAIDPREQHERWKKAKLEAGWIFGPVVDEAKKTHPCLVAYDHLPPAQRVKDDLFIAVVEAMRQGFQLPASEKQEA